uniref:RNA-directed DNA polymerase, eukaryota n=1 Tax=Tanacetum cinerariifolium TaxID=118510 RepID=A0A6L2L859_TANCI|nr:RNA-directed DNA polymerase, eukaryota [Tanacetum cinerariifolium]
MGDRRSKEDAMQKSSVVEDNKPAMVLDDSCTLQSDISLSLVGKVKEFDSLSNLKTFLADEGFVDITIPYMGGFWVLFQFTSKVKKDKFMTHVGVSSWFTMIQQASSSFKIDERVTWIDIEGVPICVWSANTFARISSKWGSPLHDEDKEAPYFHRKRLCIKTNFEDNIFETFKIIVKGKIFWIRAKEVRGWSPNFNDGDDDLFDSDDESLSERCNQSEVNQSEGEPKYPLGFTPRDASEVNSNIEQKLVGEDNDCNQKSHELSNIKKDSNASLKEDVDASVCSGHFKNMEIPQSGGLLCVWDPYMFRKEHSTMSDYFIAIMGKWSSNDKNLLIISVYAAQELSEKKMPWQYLNHMIHRWKGDVIVMGDVNEVRTQEERFGSIFNVQGAVAFNSFISSGGLVEVSSGGYSFTWSHKSASKMSKLDHFLISEGLMRSHPNISALILDRYLSDHRLILLREKIFDYGPTPFRFYHYWFQLEGFDSFMVETWSHISISESNAMLRLFKKLEVLKMKIRAWVNDKKDKTHNYKKGLKKLLVEIDSSLDKGDGTPETLVEHMNIMNKLSALENLDLLELAQKAKVKWSIKGDENSIYFHEKVKDLERPFMKEDIKATVWECGLNKSPGPDGFTFGFYQKYLSLLELDVADAANHFYTHGFCPNGCTSSFIALIPKTQDAKQILDGLFILNELIQWCKAKKKQTMIFKVDFEKAFDSIRWDFLDDVLKNFGFGDRWCDWIQSCLRSSKGSILVNGSPTSEFQFHKGLKLGVSLDNSLQLSHLFYADDMSSSTTKPFTVNLYHDSVFVEKSFEYTHGDFKVIYDVDFDGLFYVQMYDIIRRVVFVSPRCYFFKLVDQPLVCIKPLTTDEDVGQTDDPTANLGGRFIHEENDPEDDIVDPKFKAKKNICYPPFVPSTSWDQCKPVVGIKFENPLQLRKSNAGKRYGFVRFIRVYDVDRLISNLCTLWIWSHHLYANVARFMRPPAVKSGGYTHQNGKYMPKKQKTIQIMEEE